MIGAEGFLWALLLLILVYGCAIFGVCLCIVGIALMVRRMARPAIIVILAGGDWQTIEKIVEEALCKRSVAVTVWDLPAK